MQEPPIPLSVVESRLLFAIEDLASGSEDALETLASVGAAMPGWMRAHLLMQHSIPSPSGILACRYQQWLVNRQNESIKSCPVHGAARKSGLIPPPGVELPVTCTCIKEDIAAPVAWKRRRAMGVMAEPYWLCAFATAGFDVTMLQEALPIPLVSCVDCAKLGLGKSNDRQRVLLKQLSITPSIALHDIRTTVIEDAIGLEGEVVWWRKVRVDPIPAELFVGDNLGKLSEYDLAQDAFERTSKLAAKRLMNKALALGKLEGGVLDTSFADRASLFDGERGTLSPSMGASDLTTPLIGEGPTAHLDADLSSGLEASRRAAQGRGFSLVRWDASSSNAGQVLENLGSVEAERHVGAMFLRQLTSTKVGGVVSSDRDKSFIGELGESFVPGNVFLCSHGRFNHIMLAHPDGVLSNLGVTLELKDRNGWQFKSLIEGSTLATSEPYSAAQLQLNLFSQNNEWGLYLAAPADPSMLQGLLRGRKRYGSDYQLPVFYLEWVPRNDHYIENLLERAEMLANDQLSDEPPPREYGAITHKPDGTLKWPCGYCRWPQTCIDRYGIGDYR